jgi:exodeoxyribonuclease-3
MNLATWNVNGIRARCVQLQEWLARDRPDIVCLQEIKAAADQLFDVCEVEGYWTHWHGTKGYSGVAILVRQAFRADEPVFAVPSFDFETRILTATIDELTVASVYVPNGGKDFPAKLRFLDDLDAFARVTQATGGDLVICGDLNVTRAEIDVHPKERKPKAIGQLPEERAWLARLLSLGLVDVGRALDPHNDEMFSWWAPWRNMRARNIGWRLDYILASEGLARRATRCPVLAEVGTSDHAPVVATFREATSSDETP